MRIAYITNSSHLSGVGHRAKNIRLAILAADESRQIVEFGLDGQSGSLSKEGRPVASIKKWPGVFGKKSFSWLRLGKILKKYVKDNDKKEYDIFHATNQTLSWLAKDLRPMVVTVHDLIELTDPQDKKSFLINKYLISGVKSADHIIAVSDYTAKQIKDVLGVSEDKISVIHNGVGSEFQQITDFSDSVGYIEARKELDISDKAKIVLFVGSDHARKNVLGALKVFKAIKEQCGEAVFVKVGEPGILFEREKLLNQIDEMELKDSVRLVGSVSDERLVQIYNMSEVLLYPSKNEGFGLPLVQAMACGLPVVASNETVIPEVVGDGGVLVDVEDTAGMANSCLEIIKDEVKQQYWRTKGLDRAKAFSWDDAAQKVMDVYDKVADSVKK